MLRGGTFEGSASAELWRNTGRMRPFCKLSKIAARHSVERASPTRS